MATAGKEKKSKMLVAAIDFGKSFSGYAFSFKNEYNNDPFKVSINDIWTTGSMSIFSPKVPTSVLFNEKKEFHSFGYEAENNYSELALDGEHESWYFFKRFKMRLHEKKVHRDTEIEDDKGKKMLAKTVFAEVIKYLKGHLLDLLKTRGTEVINKDIHWILTVPAIWTDAAKQFMRESTYDSDIEGGQLSIVLRPEAASLYCQLLSNDQLHGSTNAKFQVGTGDKHMVIDLGGDTADITVHEKQFDGRLRELHKATVGSLGGTKVNQAFNQLLIKLVGAPLYMKFCDNNKADYPDLQREFETKKKTIKPDSSGKITIKVPVALTNLYKDEMGESVDEAVKVSPFKGKIQWLPDKMRIDAEIFKGFFEPCMKNITEHILKLLKEPEVKGTNIFLMIGGFSGSAMIQDAVIKALPNGKVIIPEEAGLSVLIGAVVFGHKPVSIRSRAAKYTYGVSMSPPFDPEVHPDDHKVTVNDIDRCRDVFKKYIQEGTTLKVGEPVSGKHISLKPGQEEMLLNIYASQKREPRFVDEEDCEYIGKIVVKLPKVEERIKVEVNMMFGETELAIEATELYSHSKTTAYFEFL